MSLLPTNAEFDLMLSFIDEACRLYGIQVKLYETSSMSMYTDNEVLSTQVDTRLLLETYMGRKLTANLKWNHQEINSEAFVAFIPIKFGGRSYSVIDNMVVEMADGDKFRILEVKKDYLIGLWYIVKLTPFVEEEDRTREGVKSSFFTSRREEVK